MSPPKVSPLLKKSEEDQAVDRIITEIAQIIFKCKFCDFITDEKLLLITHYRSTHVKPIEANTPDSSHQQSDLEERYVCSLCFSVFSSRDLVKEHMITDHRCVPKTESVDPESREFNHRSNEIDFVNSRKDTDKELHRPISLRELQLKLKSSFVIK